MDKIFFERLDDNFVNLYEIGIFIKAFEYSAYILNELFGYKLMPSINKKTGFVYIEAGFPKDQKDEILYKMNNYNIRYFDKHGSFMMIQGKKDNFLKDNDRLYNKKMDLIKLY